MSYQKRRDKGNLVIKSRLVHTLIMSNRGGRRIAGPGKMIGRKPTKLKGILKRMPADRAAALENEIRAEGVRIVITALLKLAGTEGGQ